MQEWNGMWTITQEDFLMVEVVAGKNTVLFLFSEKPLCSFTQGQGVHIMSSTKLYISNYIIM